MENSARFRRSSLGEDWKEVKKYVRKGYSGEMGKN